MSKAITATALAICLGFVGVVHGDDAKPTKPTKATPLDQQLLDDLDSDLFDGLDDLPLEDSVESVKGSGSQLDDKLLDQVGDGEDLGEEGDPLAKIANRMRAVEELIAEQKTSAQTQQLQQQIVADLAEMIEIVKKQCNCKSPSDQQQASSPKSESKAGQKKPASQANAQAGNKPSSESQMRDGKAEDAQVKREEIEQMLKEVWGHLPARVREQMQNSASEQYLNKYEALIEQYYERLAEDPDAR